MEESLPRPASDVARLIPEQLSLVDVAATTVALPDAAIKAQLDADGLTPEARKRVFDAATIKQLVSYWGAVEYRDLLIRFEKVARYYGADTHTDVIRHLLEHWEATHDRSREL